MNEGKYVSLTLEELLYRISVYLKVDVNLVNKDYYLGDNILNNSEDDIERKSELKLEISELNTKGKDISDLLIKIVGNNDSLKKRQKQS